MPLKIFKDKVLEFIRRSTKSKVTVGDVKPLPPTDGTHRDIRSELERLLTYLLNCKQSLKKLLPDRPRQRKSILVNLYSLNSLRTVSLA
jgi:hypothetical protein